MRRSNIIDNLPYQAPISGVWIKKDFWPEIVWTPSEKQAKKMEHQPWALGTNRHSERQWGRYW